MVKKPTKKQLVKSSITKPIYYTSTDICSMTSTYSCSLWTPAATSPACSLTFQALWHHQELSLVNAT